MALPVGWTHWRQGVELWAQDGHRCGHHPIPGWLTLAGHASGDTPSLGLDPPAPYASDPRLHHWVGLRVRGLAVQIGREPGTATCRGMPMFRSDLAGGARTRSPGYPGLRGAGRAGDSTTRLRVEEIWLRELPRARKSLRILDLHTFLKIPTRHR